MLRENLDTVLKDLLEFKQFEKIDSKYPGTHLDIEDNFLKNILPPNKAHTNPKSHHHTFPDILKDILDDTFDTTSPGPVRVPTLDYADDESQSNPDDSRYSLEFETTKYVDVHNPPSIKTTTAANKNKKSKNSKEVVIRTVNLNHTKTRPDKSEIVYRIRRYLQNEVKQVTVQSRSKVRQYLFNNKHKHIKRLHKFENPVKKQIRKPFLSNKIDTMKKKHKPLDNLPKSKLIHRTIPKSKRIKVGRKLQMYNSKRNIAQRNRNRHPRNAKDSTEFKPVKQHQSSVYNPITDHITENKPVDEKPLVDLVKYDLSEGDAALKARFLFKSCMNYEILEKRGHQPLLDLLDLLGGWPILDHKWQDNGFDWIGLMAKLRLYNNDILISEWVGPDIKNSDEFVIQFDQTSLGNKSFS